MTRNDLSLLLANLSMDLDWAEANEWEAPICLTDDLRKALELVNLVIKEKLYDDV